MNPLQVVFSVTLFWPPVLDCRRLRLCWIVLMAGRLPCHGWCSSLRSWATAAGHTGLYARQVGGWGGDGRVGSYCLSVGWVGWDYSSWAHRVICSAGGGVGGGS